MGRAEGSPAGRRHALGVIREAVERWSTGATKGVGVYVRPHDLRRAWASRLVAGNTPREYVMAAGGWDDENMIAQYVAHNMSDRAIADIQRRMDGAARNPPGDAAVTGTDTTAGMDRQRVMDALYAYQAGKAQAGAGAADAWVDAHPDDFDVAMVMEWR